MRFEIKEDAFNESISVTDTEDKLKFGTSKFEAVLEVEFKR